WEGGAPAGGRPRAWSPRCPAPPPRPPSPPRTGGRRGPAAPPPVGPRPPAPTERRTPTASPAPPRELPGQGLGQVHCPQAPGQVPLVQHPHPVQEPGRRAGARGRGGGVMAPCGVTGRSEPPAFDRAPPRPSRKIVG